MAQLGMDIDAVTTDGNRMQDVGQNAIPGLVSSVESIVSQLQATWHGPDSDAFVNAWNSSYKPNLMSIASEVASHGQLAVTNAQQQQATSAASGVTL